MSRTADTSHQLQAFLRKMIELSKNKIWKIEKMKIINPIFFIKLQIVFCLDISQ